MNIKQAKKVAGIHRSVKVSGREALERAIAHCKSEITTARRTNDDPRAAEVSEAQAFFKRRLHGNTCAVCGVTIARGATHCRIHRKGHKPKFLPPVPGMDQAKAQQTGNGNARVSVIGDVLALNGYYTAPVQKVVSKWSGEIAERQLKGYFMAVAATARCRASYANIVAIPYQHWPAVFELGLAAWSIHNDKNKLPYWLLTLPIHIASNDRLPDYEDIAGMIQKQSPKRFTAASIQKCLERMRLITPKKLAKKARHHYAKIAEQKRRLYADMAATAATKLA